MHLLTLDQPDNVQVASQLFLAAFQSLDAPLGLRAALWAPVLATVEEAEKRLYDHVGVSELELLSIHDQLVQEVKLAFLRCLVNVVTFDSLLHEILHLIGLEPHFI